MGGPFVSDPMLSARRLQVRLGDRTVLRDIASRREDDA